MTAPLARQLLTERVYQHLHALLASDRLAVGERVNARQIGDELQVSRTTVNKAIERLAAQGWIRPDEGRHPVVVARPPQLKVVEASAFEYANQTDSTYEYLLEKILQADFRPGEPLKERRIAQELGVNPATVRRAAEWLRNDGLLERLPRRGWQVSILTAHDLRDVYQIRVALEPMALETAIHRITENQLDELEEETDRAIALGERATVYQRRHADHHFHQTLLEAANNRILLETVEPLVRRALLVTTVAFRYGRASTSFEQHRDVLRAVRARDVKKAQKALVSHLRSAMKFNLAIWERP